MIINDLLEKEKMSRYRLSKESGVAMTTITDICSGKADLDKCTAGTLHKIAKVLNVTVDAILENNSADNVDYRCSFETFKSNTCHHVMLMYGREAQSKTKTASPATIPKSGERNRKIHSCVLYLISI